MKTTIWFEDFARVVAIRKEDGTVRRVQGAAAQQLASMLWDKLAPLEIGGWCDITFNDEYTFPREAEYIAPIKA